MKEKYVFHSSCFDKELCRKQILLLNENNIDFNTVVNENKFHFRAPLSGYFETEIYISRDDFDKADKLLKDFMEKFDESL